MVYLVVANNVMKRTRVAKWLTGKLSTKCTAEPWIMFTL